MGFYLIDLVPSDVPLLGHEIALVRSGTRLAHGTRDNNHLLIYANKIYDLTLSF
jgi:hypothetical protein